MQSCSLKIVMASLALALVVSNLSDASGQPNSSSSPCLDSTEADYVETGDIERVINSEWAASAPGSVLYVCAVYDREPIHRGLLNVEIETRWVAEIGYLKQSQDLPIGESLAYFSLFVEGRPPIGDWEIDPDFHFEKQVFAPAQSPVVDISYVRDQLSDPGTTFSVSVP
ncbi:MAG: hypothetical protein OXP69_17550 [Spirochaetaceae bacterium]|nr:hypothetical protein [Spirochaetaceae bacterium]